jgi:accessory gene regulator protein AgrB
MESYMVKVTFTIADCMLVAVEIAFVYAPMLLMSIFARRRNWGAVVQGSILCTTILIFVLGQQNWITFVNSGGMEWLQQAGREDISMLMFQKLDTLLKRVALAWVLLPVGVSLGMQWWSRRHQASLI